MHYQLEAAPYVPYPNDAMHALMKRVEELERRLRDAEGEGEIKAGGTD
jgi:tetrahydromethanopterin S-methyltransferase subunit G